MLVVASPLLHVEAAVGSAQLAGIRVVDWTLDDLPISQVDLAIAAHLDRSKKDFVSGKNMERCKQHIYYLQAEFF